MSVPGITVAQALTLRPSLTPSPDPVQGWATIVLGFPSLFLAQKPTQIELAKFWHPTTLIEWLGNNDALVPALLGQLAALTPIASFTDSYQQVLKELSTTHATLIIGNIPDVTEIGFFTSAQTIAAKTGLPLETVTSMLGIGAGDSVRVTGLTYVDQILTGQPMPTGQTLTRLPDDCPSPIPELTSSVPCRLTAADAATIRADISCYNEVIAAQAAAHHALLIDAHALVDRIYANGYQINNLNLTTNFLGGLFSLDGIHPTNTGYGIIANYFIDAMNQSLGTRIPAADIGAIAASDPLVFPGNSGPNSRSVHAAPAPSACVAPQAIGNPSATSARP